MKRLLLMIGIVLLLGGCGKAADTADQNAGQESNTAAANTKDVTNDVGETAAAEGFTFEYNGTIIPMNVDAAPIVEALGEPTDYFEAASCAFQGMDKQYYYNGFELGTYPNGKKDLVSYVNFVDDTVTTDQGICLGSTLKELLAAYGKDYTAEGTSYVYKLGKSKLTFIVEEDAVTQITYAAIVEGLNN